MDILKQDVRYLKGVGEKRRRQLYKLDVHTVEDFVYLLPRRYTDYPTHIKLPTPLMTNRLRCLQRFLK